MVLAKMFPELTQKEMETLDLDGYNQLVTARKEALEQRQLNLNISAQSRPPTTSKNISKNILSIASIQVYLKM